MQPTRPANLAPDAAAYIDHLEKQLNEDRIAMVNLAKTINTEVKPKPLNLPKGTYYKIICSNCTELTHIAKNAITSFRDGYMHSASFKFVCNLCNTENHKCESLDHVVWKKFVIEVKI